MPIFLWAGMVKFSALAFENVWPPRAHCADTVTVMIRLRITLGPWGYILFLSFLFLKQQWPWSNLSSTSSCQTKSEKAPRFSNSCLFICLLIQLFHYSFWNVLDFTTYPDTWKFMLDVSLSVSNNTASIYCLKPNLKHLCRFHDWPVSWQQTRSTVALQTNNLTPIGK